MLLTIFGAGASYDSAHFRRPNPAHEGEHSVRPPLAAQLFEPRVYFGQAVDRYGVTRPLIHRLRGLAEGASVEQALDRVYSEAQTHGQYSVQLLGLRFYLQRILWHCGVEWHKQLNGVTNYAGLLDRLDYWRRGTEKLALVTFNYDTLLEEGAGDALGFVASGLNSYIADKDYAILKPHGSVNWVRDVENIHLGTGSLEAQWVQRRVIAQGAQLRMSDNYRMANGPDDVRSGDLAYVPAIAVPLETKTTFEFPANHRARLVESIGEADKLLVIGWRGTEAHFLKLWKDTRTSSIADCLVVSGSSEGAQEIGTRLRGAGIVSDFRTSDQGFSNVMVTGDIEKFLGLER